MKKTLWAVILLLALCFLVARVSIAQMPTPTPPAEAAGTPIPGIEDRLSRLEGQVSVLEQKQEVALDASEAHIAQLQTLINWLGIVLVVFSVVFGGMAAIATWRQARQQQSLTSASVESVENVSEVLDVVHQILESRLLQAPEAEKEINSLKAQLVTMSSFVEVIKRGIGEQQEQLKSAARNLVQTSRHDFQKPANIRALDSFARDFDSFKRLYPGICEFDGRCQYIRGVAAMLNNQLQDLQDYLGKVITLERERDEDEISYRKRLANVYYYLGLFHSNLGELDEAIRLLAEAQKLDLPRTDFLTRLVMAEIYAMAGQHDKEAKALLQEVVDGLDGLKSSQGGRLYNHQLHMLSRAHLIQANMAIIARKEGWQAQAKHDAEEACKIDPGYYYARLTLGQIEREIAGGVDTEQVTALLRDAYSRIQGSGDLYSVMETRCRILLLMVAALCSRHGGMADETTANRYLDEAQSLRGELPRIDNRVCTVFSPLSKRNEKSETIGSHIEEIRDGTWSL